MPVTSKSGDHRTRSFGSGVNHLFKSFDENVLQVKHLLMTFFPTFRALIIQKVFLSWLSICRTPVCNILLCSLSDINFVKMLFDGNPDLPTSSPPLAVTLAPNGLRWDPSNPPSLRKLLACRACNFKDVHWREKGQPFSNHKVRRCQDVISHHSRHQ